MTNKHTPLPWAFSRSGYRDNCFYLHQADGAPHTVYSSDIADISGCADDPAEVSEANAAFIVKAVNHHEELVEMVKELGAALLDHRRQTGTGTMRGTTAYNLAQALLTKLGE